MTNGSMDHDSLALSLKAINEHIEGESTEAMRNRLKDTERTTRHLRIWHDLSTVANHCHLVFMVSSLYDSPIHYTNAEFEAHTGCKNVDIQSEYETPEVYIVAQSGNSNVEQLTYFETRLECLEDLSFKLKNNTQTVITDTLRFLWR